MLLRYLAKYKLHCAVYLLMMTGSTIAYSRLVLNVSPLFDALTIGDIQSVLPLFALMFFGLLAIRLVDYWADTLSISVANLIRERMKKDLFDGEIGRLDTQALERDSGEYIADYTNDITMIETKGLNAIKAFAAHIVSVITFGYTLYSIDRIMVLPVLVSLFFCIVVPLQTQKKTAAKMNLFLERFDRFIQKLDDYFSGFALMKNYGVAGKIEDEFRVDNLETETRKLKAEIRIETINAFIAGISWIMRIAVVVLGFMAVLRGMLSVGAVIAAYTLADALSSPIESMVRNYNEIGSIRGIEQKIERALSRRSDEAKSVSVPAEGCRIIEIENVSVNMENTLILSDVSLVLEAGKRYLIVGDNGSGKSTLMRVLNGVVPVTSGQIRINGRSTDTWGKEAINRLICYSNEKVSLFSETVKENLTFYDQEDKHRLDEAIAQAKLEVPTEHEIGDGGKRISSGEKRRLEIARSLYHRAPVLIFDEVISTLDIETAYEIEKLILSLQDRIIVMVSNAFSGSLLPQYDQIILMDSGKIIAQGTHDELLSDCPDYRTLYDIRCGQMPRGGD